MVAVPMGAFVLPEADSTMATREEPDSTREEPDFPDFADFLFFAAFSVLTPVLGAFGAFAVDSYGITEVGGM